MLRHFVLCFALVGLGLGLNACSPVTFYESKSGENGTITMSHTFHFPNQALLCVESSSAPYEWTEHKPAPGSKTKGYGELRVTMNGRQIVATDRDLAPGTLLIDGKLHKGEAFLMHPDLKIEQLPPPPR